MTPLVGRDIPLIILTDENESDGETAAALDGPLHSMRRNAITSDTLPVIASFLQGHWQIAAALKNAEEKVENLENLSSRSQRLETIGCLVGGIAHELRGLLTPIVGYALKRNTSSM